MSQIKVDQITDEAGTGAPEFPNGILAAAGVPSYQYVSTVTFTASGTFDKATYPWLRAVRVRVQGGGGGGRGPSATSGASGITAGGGAAGGYSEKWIAASGLGASETVTIGAGGAGGAAGGNNGADGGTSSFGLHCSATGGGFGSNGGGIGGQGTGGDINGAGGAGGHRSATETTSVVSGHGGSSVFAGGGYGQVSQLAGGNGSLGSGGGGGYNNRAGGNGGAGIVIVELFA